MSTSGALILTTSPLQKGDSIHLSCTTALKDTAAATGCIVHTGLNSGDRGGLWHYRAGVEFEAPATRLASAVERTRSAILACGLRACVRERVGTTALTMEAIARDLNVEVGVVGQYFSDTTSIGESMIVEVARAITAETLRALEARDALDPVVVVLEAWATSLIRVSHWSGARIQPDNPLLRQLTEGSIEQVQSLLLDELTLPALDDTELAELAELVAYSTVGLLQCSNYLEDFRDRIRKVASLYRASFAKATPETDASA